MKNRLFLILSALWLAIEFMAGSTSPVLASTPTVFIDYDGDGIDDNVPDDDTDGIPDECEHHGFISASVTQLGASPMFSGSATPASTPQRPRPSEAFGRRKFSARAISENRADFDSGFGSSLGLGGGLGAGGGCAGGVCF